MDLHRLDPKSARDVGVPGEGRLWLEGSIRVVAKEEDGLLKVRSGHA